MLSDIKKLKKRRQGVQRNGWFFYNLPVFHPKKEYDDLISQVVNKYKKIDNLYTIYQIGHIVPGISDIDFIFIFKDANKKVRINFDTNNYMFMHGPEYIPLDLAKKIFLHMIKRRFNLKKLFGKDVKFMEPDKEFFKKMNLQLAIHTFYNEDRTLLNYILEKKVDVRYLLCKLNFFRTRKFIFDEAGINIDNSDEIDKFCNDVDNLRNKWFSEDMFSEMIRLLNESEKVISWLRESARKHLMKTELSQFRKHISVFLRKQFRLIFTFLDVDEDKIKKLNMKSRNVYFLPSVFQFPLYLYSKIENDVGYSFSKDFLSDYKKEPVILDDNLKKATASWIKFEQDKTEYCKKNNLNIIYTPGIMSSIKFNLLNFKKFTEYYKIKTISKLSGGYLEYFRKKYKHH